MGAEIELAPVHIFDLAERICKSNLIPSAYRGKATDTAIAMMYGQEMGMPPMSSLQRVVVIEGKPAMDSQGMIALIRKAGHSVSGEVSENGAFLHGKRRDTGDEMHIEWGPEDAIKAGLAGKGNYTKYVEDMYWARAVSRLARRLFADVLLGVSYTPDEITSFREETAVDATVERHTSPVEPEIQADGHGEIIDAEIVEETGESVPDEFLPDEADSAPEPISEATLTDIRTLQRDMNLSTTQLKVMVQDIIGRAVAKSNEMTEQEGRKVIDELANKAAAIAAEKSKPVARGQSDFDIYTQQGGGLGS